MIMQTSSNVAPVRTIELPEPGYPMLTRMITNNFFSETGKESAVTWIVGKEHPLVPEMKVMRMFIDRGGVEVYSASNDGHTGMRNVVPMSWVRLIEEAMPIDVFATEMDIGEALAATEREERAEEAFDEPEPEPKPAPAPSPTPNGQPS